ncbi:ribonuclease HII [Cellulomonas sp.]|uniref:ribonuclease HII n=1 Tax=Cellulomonas sp. TaxID=40001 RepID=UPI002582E998|nr:ribonuclease HII [Cellulomonas sp.]MCR6689633.1 ribonuclease HII [Cellulomonas sp.]
MTTVHDEPVVADATSVAARSAAAAATPRRAPVSGRGSGGARPGPHLRHERALLRSGARLVAGMDEVGRGSLAGPVSVGVVVVGLETRSAPRGVADSKLLTPAARTALLPALGRWGVARAVGHASPAEIDAIGIIAALRLAGHRALAAVGAVAGPVDVVLLDGNHDWLTPSAQGELFTLDAAVPVLGAPPPAVHLRIKADRTCASVAAASVLAKCERDALMTSLAPAHPAYRWDENKGYASPEHVAALRALGPSALHRRSWRLPAGDAPGAVDLDVCAPGGGG